MKFSDTLRLAVFAAIAAAAVTMPALAAGAQAQPRAFDPELLRSGDLIRYRALDREDFLAARPPAEAAAIHGQLGAATCVFLTTDPRTTIRASSDGADEQRGVVRAQVENLAFIAYMDRGCSWWNPSPMALPAGYILQHEQIHFALFEVAARRLNARRDELTEQLQVTSTGQQRAIDEVHRRIDFEMQIAMDEIVARSNDFDRDTSRSYRQDRQTFWWDRVTGELELLAVADVRP